MRPGHAGVCANIFILGKGYKYSTIVVSKKYIMEITHGEGQDKPFPPRQMKRSENFFNGKGGRS